MPYSDHHRSIIETLLKDSVGIVPARPMPVIALHELITQGIRTLSLDSIDFMREQHDASLRALRDTLNPEHALYQPVVGVLRGRDSAAVQVRSVLSRVYGRPDMATFHQWHVIPCLSTTGTIGIVDIARGTAWDTEVPADTGIHDLGLTSAMPSANNPAVALRPDTDAPIGFELPAGWQQIALPTWRMEGAYVPEREEWIRPQLVAARLGTVYGSRGTCSGDALARTHTGFANQWPNGIPPWIAVEQP